MGAGLYAVQLGWRVDLETALLPEKLLYLAVLFAFAAGGYVLLAYFLKVRELGLVMGILKGRRPGGDSR
jgi:hypothetical protein